MKSLLTVRQIVLSTTYSKLSGFVILGADDGFQIAILQQSISVHAAQVANVFHVSSFHATILAEATVAWMHALVWILQLLFDLRIDPNLDFESSQTEGARFDWVNVGFCNYLLPVERLLLLAFPSGSLTILLRIRMCCTTTDTPAITLCPAFSQLWHASAVGVPMPLP